MKLVSVIIPNFNRGELIERTLRSVMMQQYKDLEIIVVDNCSTDNSIYVIEKLAIQDSRIKLIKLSKNSGGPAEPRNIGMRASKGDYLAFIDSDDLWHPEKIKIQLDFLKKHNASFVSSEKINFINENDVSEIMLDSMTCDDIEYERINFSKLIKQNIINGPSVLLSRDIIIGYSFKEGKEYIAVEDYYLWLKLHENIKYSYKLKKPLLYYRVSSDSITPHPFRSVRQKLKLYLKYDFNEKISIFGRLRLVTNYLLRHIQSKTWRTKVK